jgi:ribonuclease HII
LTELLQVNHNPDDGAESVLVFVDKHGGRNTYAAMLQNALSDGLVVAEKEGMEQSVYRVLGLKRELRFTFQPRADATHMCVALASMLSKYLREVLMLEFNRFWQSQVPGLKATAGYPGDSSRFFDSIRPALPRLGLAEEAVWRRK